MAVDGLLAARPSSLIAPRGVWWEVFSSLAETPPVVNVEVETCSHCPARLSLSYLGWTTCLPGRLFTDLGKGKAAGGNACPGQRCSPTAIAVSRGLPLSTSVILMGSGTTTFQDLVRKGVRRCCGASARVLCPGCGQRVLFVASTLAVPSVTTKVSNECQRRRKSAHQRSLSRLEAIPSLSSPLASLSPVMSLTPTVVDLGWFMSSGCKNCSWRREPSRGSILGDILHVMRRSGGGRMESPPVSQ